MDYIVFGVSGFVVGAIIFGLTYGTVFPAISGIANLGVVYLPDLFHINDWLLITLLALVSAYLFYILEKKGDRRSNFKG